MHYPQLGRLESNDASCSGRHGACITMRAMLLILIHEVCPNNNWTDLINAVQMQS